MSNERTVHLDEIDERKASSLLGVEAVLVEGTAEDVEQAIPRFEEKEYPCFTTKHAVVDGHIVIQFFLPKAAGSLKTADARVQQRWESFWLEDFRDKLSPVAQEYFGVDYPQIVAKYTEELASWWFQARGFGNSVDPLRLASEFEEKLNYSLLSRLVQS